MLFYIVTKLDIKKSSVEIVNSFTSETAAIEELHTKMKTYNDNETSIFDALIVSQHRIEIVERQFGWIFNSKELLFVYEISKHENFSI